MLNTVACTVCIIVWVKPVQKDIISNVVYCYTGRNWSCYLKITNYANIDVFFGNLVNSQKHKRVSQIGCFFQIWTIQVVLDADIADSWKHHWLRSRHVSWALEASNINWGLAVTIKIWSDKLPLQQLCFGIINTSTN